jgi:hypothetical protein
MENTRSTTDRHRRRQRVDMSAWAEKNLAPYWGLWLVAFGTVVAFAVVIVWFAS